MEDPGKSLIRNLSSREPIAPEMRRHLERNLDAAGDGRAGNPITVSSYGTGERPLIRRSIGNNVACMVIDKASGCHIHDLEMACAQHAIRVMVDSRVKTTTGDYLIENCFLRDIANPTFPDPAKKDVYSHIGLREMGWRSS